MIKVFTVEKLLRKCTVVGGGGGGRPDMAQAGGKNPEKINEAVENAYEIIEKLVK